MFVDGPALGAEWQQVYSSEIKIKKPHLKRTPK